MSEFKIDIDGDEEIKALLDDLSKPFFLQPAMNRIGARIRTMMAKYPPPPPNSRYRRTGRLGRAWTHEVKAGLFSIETIVGNNTPYAPDVQGAGTQAVIHVGRWQTDEEVLRQSAEFIGDEIEEEIEKKLRE
ncbi:MAG: hypothetical protein HC804_04110 [Anaerolineae bacterium]|nr:hypothetical protein [Anaerolineae bacterium]